MKKLVRGIVEFHTNLQPSYRETFARLALGQQPDALFVACSDSRVAVNVFASTDPGDLFVVRNVGNLIPPCGDDGHCDGDESAAAAVEFAVDTLGVSDIAVCGHAECGGMAALVRGLDTVRAPHLRRWLRHGLGALGDGPTPDANTLSRRNVLLQIEHLRSYPDVRRRHEEGKLRLHALWFDLPRADVYYHDPERDEWVVLDEETGRRILARL